MHQMSRPAASAPSSVSPRSNFLAHRGAHQLAGLDDERKPERPAASCARSAATAMSNIRGAIAHTARCDARMR
jgi:hypothetical protein